MTLARLKSVAGVRFRIPRCALPRWTFWSPVRPKFLCMHCLRTTFSAVLPQKPGRPVADVKRVFAPRFCTTSG